WLKKEGDEVHSGDVVAEIETDKATMEVEAVDDGRIGRLLVPEGAQGVKVNQAIALLLTEDEDASALEAAAPARGGRMPEAPGPAPPPPAGAGPSLSPRPAGESRGKGPAPPSATASAANGARIFASPLARRMAAQAGLDLAAIRGSGPQG